MAIPRHDPTKVGWWSFFMMDVKPIKDSYYSGKNYNKQRKNHK